MSTIVIPPYSFFIHEPIKMAKIDQILANSHVSPTIGAMLYFTGIVRADEIDGHRVTAIDFSAHESLAEKQIREIIFRESGDDIQFVFVQHSLGIVPVGSIPLVIVVGSGHRPEGYRTSRAILEALKAEVPIFGKELFEDGSHAWKVNT